MQGDIHLANFIKEQCAAIGADDRACAVCCGSGKGPFSVAEQFRFDQVLWNCCAIEGNERACVPRARIVNGLGADLLAGATLASDKDSRLRGGHILDHPIDGLHGRAGANKTKSALFDILAFCFRAWGLRER